MHEKYFRYKEMKKYFRDTEINEKYFGDRETHENYFRDREMHEKILLK